MRAFSIVEGDKMGDSPHQIRFRRIMPAVQFFLFENGKERFRNRIVMGASCSRKGLFYSKVLQQVNERMAQWCGQREYVTYIDTPAKLTTDMLADGTHPKLENYAVFTDALAQTDIQIEDKEN